jgi:hypothetical protein
MTPLPPPMKVSFIDFLWKSVQPFWVGQVEGVG